MKKAITEWLEISRYDLQTAKVMLESGRYLYVTFMYQQSIEKILKAIYVKNKEKLPPGTHNLLYLIDELKIDISQEHSILLSQLNQFYIESRYPDERIALAKALNKKKASDILTKTNGAWICLKQKLA